MTTTSRKTLFQRLLDFLFGTPERVHIKGLLIDRSTRKPLDHLGIEAWLQTENEAVLLDRETSDEQGRFCFSLKGSQADFHCAQVFFRVFAASGNLLYDSQHSNCWEPEHKGLVVIELDTTMQTVKGKITLASGNPAIQLRVEVSRKTLKEEQLLATTKTDVSGAYELKYLAAGVGAIIVRVFNPKGKVPIATSSILNLPRIKEEIDLMVEAEHYESLALFDAIEQLSAKFLGSLDVEKLDENQLALLANESGIQAVDLRNYHAAMLRSQDHALSPEVFFAILESGVSVDEEAFMLLSEEALKHILAQAWDEHVISTARSSQLLKEISAHETESIRYQLNRTSFTAGMSLSDAWESVQLSAAVKEKLGAKLRSAGGRSAKFWSELEQDEELKNLVPELEYLTSLKNLTLGNQALIGKISGNKALRRLEDLVGWSHDKWIQLIGNADIPEEIQGKPNERIHTYAKSMKRMVDYLHPTRSVWVSIASDETQDAHLREDYVQFFQRNADFRFEMHSPERYLVSHPEALEGIKDADAFREDLALTARFFRISPSIDRYENIQLLRKSGHRSARSIVQGGASQFEREFSSLGGTSNASQVIFRNAQHTQAMVNTLAASFILDHEIQVYVYNNNIKQDPTWKTLFGSEDYCGCQHCKSVYSPAAYLTDTLNFLDHRKLSNNRSLYTVLDERRPDIKHILLNCENANTPMPYIDLVNEILELAVIHDNLSEVNFDVYQTTYSMEELLANPEHQEQAAYAVLKRTVFPWYLPYDFNNSLGKIYLEHLGVRHHKLVELFPFTERAISPLNSASGDLLTNQDRLTMATLNLNKTDWNLLLGIAYQDMEKDLWNMPNGIQVDVERVMKALQLSLDDLKILVDTKFVNPTGKLSLHFPDPCSLEGAEIKNSSTEIRKRMLQLLRLGRKLNADIRTADHLLFALGASEITKEVLADIAQALRWKEVYQLPFAELSAWLGSIPTSNRNDPEGHEELYEQLFLGRFDESDATVRPCFELSADKKSLANNYGLNNLNVRNYIAGALKLKSAELDLLIENLPSQILTLSNLSTLYAYASFARAKHLEINDLCNLLKVLPQGLHIRIARLDLLENIMAKLRSAGMPARDFLYLLGQVDEQNISATRIYEIAEDLVVGLWKLRNQGMEENNQDPLSPEAFIVDRLATLFELDRGVIDALIQKKDDHVYLESCAAEGIIASLDAGNSDDFLAAALQKLNQVKTLFAALHFQPQHYASLLTPYGKAHWIDLNALGTQEIFNSLLTLLEIDEIVMERSESQINLFELLQSTISQADPFSQVDRKKNTVEFLAYPSVQALEIMLRALGADSDSAGNVIDLSVYSKLLKARNLEVYLGIQVADHVNSEGQFEWAVSSFEHKPEAIIQTAKSKHGEDKWQGITKSLRDALREEQRDALLSYLMATRKDASGNALNSAEKVYAHFLVDTEMSACMQTSRIRLALSSVQLFAQRCLMNLEPAVRMEDLSTLEQEEWKEWAWRKNYRVWEANRKVFLYPENWLEPEWRDDKTLFFQELERELQQNDLSNELAESALSNYLHKLEAVSNLEIMAICEAEKPNDILSGYYIFGRTRGNPKALYFRKYCLEPESFTHWEKVEIDFQGDHLMPIIYHGRLFLFWPVFSLQNMDGKSGNEETGITYNESRQYWKIEIKYTELREGNSNTVKTLEHVFHTSYMDGELTTSDDVYPYVAQDQYLSLDLASRKNHFEFELDLDDDMITVHCDSNFKDASFQYTLYANFRINPMRGNSEFERFVRFGEIHLGNVFGPLTDRRFNSRKIVDSTYYRSYGLETLLLSNVSNDDYSLQLTNLALWNCVNRKIGFIRIAQMPPIGGLYRLRNFGYSKISEIVKTVSTEKLSALFEIPGIANAFPPVEMANLEYANSNFLIEDFQNGLKDKVEFGNNEAYGRYNWELFFHIPMLVANKLRQDQKFEEAQRWFHYVFNPTSSQHGASPQKFWIFQPFRDYVCSNEEGVPCNIMQLMRMLSEGGESDHFQQLEQSVHAWERNPFSPHTVARTRIIAYMKWVVMRYIDNLIEWADLLFRRDSMESLNEATQLYVLAWNILGTEPQQMSEQKMDDRSYLQLMDKLDEFSNALMNFEERITPQNTSGVQAPNLLGGTINAPQVDFTDLELTLPKVPQLVNQGQDNLLPLKGLYFCVPQNEVLLSYWDVVKDRFFKLRHCQNIEGVYRQLPLYEPPIDPALLIRAKAAGLSIAEALSGEYAPQSHYRFLALLQKAVDYANDVRAFGGALLTALEKKDAEQMIVLRSRHDLQLLNEVTQVRKDQIEELSLSNQSLELSRMNIEHRRQYYASKEFMSPREREQQKLLKLVNVFQTISQSTSLAASLAQLVPTIDVGYSGWGGHLTTQQGGIPAAKELELYAQAFSLTASIYNMEAGQVGQSAGYERRFEDWKFQASTADWELKQIDKQILAAQIRMSIAQQELKNHELQVENSTKQFELVQTKFTSYELYDWMVGQLKTLYFQSYQMAFDMAKKAERALSYEHGIGAETAGSFIKFGYWDNLKEGLLCGEKLHHDLKRMEMIYMQRNKRLHEVSKTISLAMLDAEELARLRAVGVCTLRVPELFFDLDFPQHTDRKIKSVSLTIPAVIGPYTGINAVLSDLHDSIACTGSQNDAGLFQFNFNDERYLPFEGKRFEGPEGEERFITFDLKMNGDFRTFDYNSITDVLLHLHYTAEEIQDTETLKTKRDAIANRLSERPFMRIVSVKNDFPEAWFEAKSSGVTTLQLDSGKISLPYFAQGRASDLSIRYAALDAQGQFPLTEVQNSAGTAQYVQLQDATPSHTGELALHVPDLAKARDVILAVRYTLDGM